MDINDKIRLRLSGQRALFGEISNGVLSVSIDLDKNDITWRCIYETSDDKDRYWPDLSNAASEVIGDFSSEYTINEEHLVQGLGIVPLQILLYLRKSAQQVDAPEPGTR